MNDTIAGGADLQVPVLKSCHSCHSPNHVISVCFLGVTDPAYPAARAVAGKVREHFADHIDTARRYGRDVSADPPDEIDIEEMIDAAFWASLRREEGATPTISLALLPPEGARQAITFAQDL